MTELSSDQCLSLLLRGANEMRRGNLTTAGQLFSAVIEAARSMPKEQSYALFPLATANLSLLARRQGKPDQAAQLRSITLTTLDALKIPPLHAGFLQLIADALFDLGEHRRAIPYYELCAQIVSDNGNAINTAALLARAGQCYCRSGLHEQGAIPLRAAIRIFREQPGDPRMPDALLNLGNALRKRFPAQAEEAYKEAAVWYESRLQLEAAAPAWVNLGILCSENDRPQEALEWYSKALEVRQRSPRTPPARIAGVLNNIANCYRRIGKLTEAHTEADRAIEILEASAPEDQAAAQLLASAYHTRGLIFAAEARDTDALAWFLKADAARQKLPSPSLEDTAVDLTELVAVLDRLGRTQEADAARERLATIRAAQQTGPTPEVDISGLSGENPGAVLIEIDQPTSRSQEAANQIAAFGRQLGDQAAASETGFFSGSVTIPEAVTLMLYGPDAEALFRTVEPTLRSDPLSRSARVTLRQGSHTRELTLATN
jgi:tetratricopeptide (TPR) repeat protein